MAKIVCPDCNKEYEEEEAHVCDPKIVTSSNKGSTTTLSFQEGEYEIPDTRP